MKKLIISFILSLWLFWTSFALYVEDAEPIQLWEGEMMITSIEDQSYKEIKFYKDWKEPIVYKTLEDLLKNEKDVKYISDWCNSWFVMKDWNVWMTEMYCEDIYGKNWTMKWIRTDNLVVIQGDTADYINKNLYIKLYKNSTKSIQKQLSEKSKVQLEKALEKTEKLIETTKLTKIAKFMQDKKITQLYFIKMSIQEELNKKEIN